MLLGNRNCVFHTSWLRSTPSAYRRGAHSRHRPAAAYSGWRTHSPAWTSSCALYQLRLYTESAPRSVEASEPRCRGSLTASGLRPHSHEHVCSSIPSRRSSGDQMFLALRRLSQGHPTPTRWDYQRGVVSVKGVFERRCVILNSDGYHLAARRLPHFP